MTRRHGLKVERRLWLRVVLRLRRKRGELPKVKCRLCSRGTPLVRMLRPLSRRMLALGRGGLVAAVAGADASRRGDGSLLRRRPCGGARHAPPEERWSAEPDGHGGGVLEVLWRAGL